MAKKRKQPESSTPQPKLARPGDPYVAIDGTVIPYRYNGKAVSVETTKPSFSRYRPQAKRTAKELPAPMNIMNGVACLIMYTLLGLGEREIADGMKCSVNDVKSIRKSKAYEETFEVITGEFVNVNSELVSARIAGYANDALDTVVDVMQQGRQESNRLKAGMGLLEMGGHSKKQDARLAGNVNELRIIVSEGEKQVNVQVQ